MLRLAAISILLLLLPALPAHADSGFAEISLNEIHGPFKGATYALRWKEDHSRCEATQSYGSEVHWKAVPFSACQKVLEFLFKNQSGLDQDTKTQSDPNHALPVGKTPRARIGLLSYGSQKWYVNLNTAKTCDENFQNCQEPKLPTSSKLALELRTAITAELGRLK